MGSIRPKYQRFFSFLLKIGCALPSLKFAPLHTYDRTFEKPNSYVYYITCLQNDKFEDTDSPHIESFSSVYSQLKYLANFLRGCYLEYALNHEKVFSRVVMRKRKQILKDLTVSTTYFYVIIIIPITAIFLIS